MVYLDRQRPRQEGLALLLAIFTCVILVVLAVGIAGLVRVELLASRGSFDRLQARGIARAGFNLARSVLMYKDDLDTTPLVDSLNDSWAKLSEDMPEEFGEGSFRVVVVDAASRININTADLALLSKVFNDADLAQAIIDWRENTGKFYSLGDMLQVEGMTLEKLQPVEQWLTAESWENNVSAAGAERLDINNPANQAKLKNLLKNNQSWDNFISWLNNYQSPNSGGKLNSLAELVAVWQKQNSNQYGRPPFFGAVIDQLDQISFSNAGFVAGKINFNTAPREVLELLPGSTSDFVEAVLSKRQQETDNSFNSPSDVIALLRSKNPNINKSDPDLIAFCDLVSTKSAGFIIESEGDLKDRPAHCILQGVVMRRPERLEQPGQPGQPGPIAPISSGLRELTQQMFLAGNDNP
jgi:type II secretory pathway component PulK